MRLGGRVVPLRCRGSSPTWGPHVLGVQQCGRIDVSVILSALSNLDLLQDNTGFLDPALPFLVSPPWQSSVSPCLLTGLFKAVETFPSFSSSLQAPPTAHARAASTVLGVCESSTPPPATTVWMLFLPSAAKLPGLMPDMTPMYDLAVL